jgi:hypothetical protein
MVDMQSQLGCNGLAKSNWESRENKLAIWIDDIYILLFLIVFYNLVIKNL